MKTLQSKFLALTVGSMFLLGLVVQGINTAVTTSTLTAQAQQDFSQKAEALAERYDDWVDSYQRLGTLLAASDALRSADRVVQSRWLGDVLARAKALDPAVDNMLVVDSRGTAYYGNGTTKDVSQVEVVKAALAQKTFLLGNAIRSPSTGHPIISLVFPASVGDQEQYLIIAIDLSHILDLTKSSLAGKSYAVLYDAKGRFLGHPDPEVLLKSSALGPEEGGSPELTAIQNKMLAGEKGFGSYVFRGVKKVMAYTPVAQTGWFLAVTDEQSTIDQAVAHQLVTELSIQLGVTVIIILLALPVVFWVTKTARKFSHQLAAVSGDDSIKGDLTQRLQVVSQDEMGQAARFFNQFLADLQQILVSVEASIEKVGAQTLTMVANVEETAASISQINGHVGKVQDEMTRFGQTVAQTEASVGRMGQVLEETAQNVEVQSSAIDQASSAVEELVANLAAITRHITQLGAVVQGLNRASDQGRNRLEATMGAIRTVAERSEALGSTNAVLQSIASQTNLLAMNAAIEAAHAGAAGRGFAVVADEIRKLAESAGVQSKEIQNELKTMAEAVGTIVGASTETEQAFGAILGQVGQVSQMEQEIRHSLTEQDAGSNQILDSLRSLKEATAHVSSNSAAFEGLRTELQTRMGELVAVARHWEQALGEIAQGTQEITEAAGVLNQAALANRTAFDDVQGALGQLKIRD